MPNVPLVDAHLHLWDPSRFRLSWLDGNFVLDRPYGLVDYATATGGVDVAAMVYLQTEVETPYALLEARWADAQAAEDPRLQGVVAWAPMEHGDRACVFLDELAATTPHLKGIRRIIQFEPDLDFCLRPDFVRGIQLLPDYGLSFDLCIAHQHLPNTIELVRRCPDVSFVLDHIAKPDIRDGAYEPWATQIGELAALPNVWCKISGVVTEANHATWTTEAIAPFVWRALEVFGEDRVMFGGDWPVVLQAASYRRWVEALDTLTADLSNDARRKLWADNARRFYRLPDPS
ncbi:MAG: amidohydrolase family protein [Thermomicrobiales bacterium]|nr:amidohydrolase family protein [Thermomicrobiales bacterium]